MLYPTSQPIEGDAVASASGAMSGGRRRDFRFNTHYAKLPFWPERNIDMPFAVDSAQGSDQVGTLAGFARIDMCDQHLDRVLLNSAPPSRRLHDFDDHLPDLLIGDCFESPGLLLRTGVDRDDGLAGEIEVRSEFKANSRSSLM
jgi:hypothetical protein